MDIEVRQQTSGKRRLNAWKRLSSPFFATQSTLLDDGTVTAHANAAARSFGFSSLRGLYSLRIFSTFLVVIGLQI